MTPCDLNNFTFLCRGSLKYADGQKKRLTDYRIAVLKMMIYDDVNTKEQFLDHLFRIEGWPKDK